jgi:hypothetical protein
LATSSHYCTVDVVSWKVRECAERQPPIEDLIGEAEVLLIMVQAALKTCRSPDIPRESETRLLTVANTLQHLRSQLGRIRTSIAGN